MANLRWRYLILLAAFLGGGASPVAAAPGSLARVLHDLPSAAEDALSEVEPGLDAYAVALAVADTSGALISLETTAIPAYLSAWLRGRIESAAGEPTADDHLADAVRLWRRSIHSRAESREVPRQIDRDRVGAAVRAGDWNRARRALRDPLVTHVGDERWKAFLGVVAHGRGDPDRGSAYLDEAWSKADDFERRHWAFAWRSLAHLARGDEDRAADVWLEFVEGLQWPAELRDATVIWDENPALREVVEREGQWLRAIRWQVRILRREAALETALHGWHAGSGRESAACFVQVAEQLYRLRRHTDLESHLQSPWPSDLDGEERASLEAYPWGVLRRSGPGIEIARGFDAVADRHPDTRRAAEALWEAAWMYELSGELDAAQQRFTRYARDYARAPFAPGAIVRAILLAIQAGRVDEAAELYAELSAGVGSESDAAAAAWLAGRAYEQLGDERAQAAFDRLARDHVGNPFLDPPPLPLQTWRPESDDVAVTLASLFERQRWALSLVARELGVEDLRRGNAEDLVVAERMLELGVSREGDGWLARYAAERRRDPEAQLRALAVAWRLGRAERQARSAFQLDLLLRGRSEDLDRALQVLAHPTPYARAVLAAARENDLPPGLIWGLIRRESFYDAEVVSLAGAYGLMQLLPSTARRVAARLGDAEPAESDLRRPFVNLRLGTAYLSGLLEESGGNPYQALAAYNAGESNGRRWMTRLDPDAPPQELILLISYSETRRYVYHVLRHLSLYALAYEAMGPRDDGLADP